MGGLMMFDFFRKLLSPQKAIEFLAKKGIHVAFDWRDTEKQLHDISFTAAKLMEKDVLNDVKNAIDAAISSGQSYGDFQKELIPKLAQRGWWGEKEVTDPETGNKQTVQVSPSRIRKIYNTNLNVAYSEGRWERIQETKKVFQYLEYSGCNSKENRPDHCSWNGLVLPVDDPWWQAHYPIKEWGCKCTVRQLTKSQANKKGIDDAPKETFIEWKNERTGKTMNVPSGVSPSFYREQGLDNWKDSLDKALEEK